MSKVRVYELAKELNTESRCLLAALRNLGEFPRSASSTLAAPVVKRVREMVSAGELHLQLRDETTTDSRVTKQPRRSNESSQLTKGAHPKGSARRAGIGNNISAQHGPLPRELPQDAPAEFRAHDPWLEHRRINPGTLQLPRDVVYAHLNIDHQWSGTLASRTRLMEEHNRLHAAIGYPSHRSAAHAAPGRQQRLGAMTGDEAADSRTNDRRPKKSPKESDKAGPSSKSRKKAPSPPSNKSSTGRKTASAACKDCGNKPISGFRLCGNCAKHRGQKVCVTCGAIFQPKKKQARLRQCYDCRYKAGIRRFRTVSGGLPTLGKRK